MCENFIENFSICQSFYKNFFFYEMNVYPIIQILYGVSVTLGARVKGPELDLAKISWIS